MRERKKTSSFFLLLVVSLSTSTSPHPPHPLSRPPPHLIHLTLSLSLFKKKNQTFLQHSQQPSGYSVADWAAAFDSQLEEFDYEIRRKKKEKEKNGYENSNSPVAYVEGEIPAALRGGTLYRNGPARFERGGERYAHMLDGDGYVCRFGFSEDGESVAFRSRFVKTRCVFGKSFFDFFFF